MERDRQRVYMYGYMAIVGTFMVGLGEFLVHYSPSYDPSIPYGFFLGISPERFRIGHFLMITFIPLYIYGYWHLFLALQGRVRIMGKIILSVGIVAFIVGAIWMGSRAQLGMMIQTQAAAGESAYLFDELVSFYEKNLEVLVYFLRAMIVLISILFVWAVLDGHTWYPKWMLFFNPLLLVIILYLIALGFPSIGKYLVPTILNVAHLILFIASIIALKGMEAK